MNIIRLKKNFPVYLVKNFYRPFFRKKSIIKKVLENKKLYHNESCDFNFPIKNDYRDFFKNLYLNYYKFCKKKFIFTKKSKSSETCWAYVSDKNDFKEYWHNHLLTSTINAVYYLNVPKGDKVTIEFRNNNNEILEYKINNNDLIIFPNYLDHKPNRCYKDGYRISINMEINCNETSNHIFNNMR